MQKHFSVLVHAGGFPGQCLDTVFYPQLPGMLISCKTVSARSVVLMAQGLEEQEQKVSLLRKRFNEEDFCSFSWLNPAVVSRI